ncbi:hypothetical protein HYW20_02305 [Candidatus Woesearchaeota archaeon]|nr:hypothetical protein [Candidatus Woesearchaeota archaeon]
MKSIQLKKIVKIDKIKNNLLKNSIIAGVIGFLSWASLFLIFIPLADYYKFGKVYTNALLLLLQNPNFYLKSLFVGLIFFLFFYLNLKYKEKSQFAKFIMWAGVIGYTLFYLGYLFLLFFFRFTDL